VKKRVRCEESRNADVRATGRGRGIIFLVRGREMQEDDGGNKGAVLPENSEVLFGFKESSDFRKRAGRADDHRRAKRTFVEERRPRRQNENFEVWVKSSLNPKCVIPFWLTRLFEVSPWPSARIKVDSRWKKVIFAREKTAALWTGIPGTKRQQMTRNRILGGRTANSSCVKENDRERVELTKLVRQRRWAQVAGKKQKDWELSNRGKRVKMGDGGGLKDSN